MNKPTLKIEAKRCWIYTYGTDGEITVSKRITSADEMDYADLLDSGEVQIRNSSDCSAPINLSDHLVDPEALTALDMILEEIQG